MNRSRVVSVIHDVEHHCRSTESTQPNASHAHVRVPSRARVREHSHTRACTLRTSERSRVPPSVRPSACVVPQAIFNPENHTTTSHEPSSRDCLNTSRSKSQTISNASARLLDATSNATRDRTRATRDANGFLHFIHRNARGSGASTRAWAVDKVDSSCSYSCEKC